MRDPLTGNYTEIEQTQMLKIQQLYRYHINDELPATLRMNEGFTRPVTKVTIENFAKQFWEGKLGAGVLQGKAGDLLYRICDYQSRRISFALAGGESYCDDPTNLCLENLKTWLVVFLSNAACNEATIDEVRRRVGYLRALLTGKIFLSVQPKEETPDGVEIESVESLLNIICRLLSALEPIILQTEKEVSSVVAVAAAAGTKSLQKPPPPSISPSSCSTRLDSKGTFSQTPMTWVSVQFEPVD